MLTILTAPNDLLSLQAKSVKKVDKSIRSLIEAMKQTLIATHDPEGVGLAAVQVGKPLRLFVTLPKPHAPITTYINPDIKILQENASQSGKERKKKRDSSVTLEGCLSLPNIWGEVKRPYKIRLISLDETGKQKEAVFKGFEATIIQHELDHLNGLLFPKRVLEQKGKLYKSRKNDKGETIFEEIEI